MKILALKLDDRGQGLVVRSLDSAIHRINPFNTNALKWITFIRWMNFIQPRTTCGPGSLNLRTIINDAIKLSDRLGVGTSLIGTLNVSHVVRRIYTINDSTIRCMNTKQHGKFYRFHDTARMQVWQ